MAVLAFALLAASYIHHGSCVNVTSNLTASTGPVISAVAPFSAIASPAAAIGDYVASAVGLSKSDAIAQDATVTTSISLSTSSALSSLTSVPSTVGNATTTFLDVASLKPAASSNSSDNGVTGCLAALAQYAAANSSWFEQPGHITVINSTFVTNGYASWWTVRPKPYTTLCDGWPRAYSSDVETHTINTTKTTWSTTTTAASPLPTRPPTCTLKGGECARWWTSHWSCSSSSLFTLISDAAKNASCAPYLINEPCSQPADFTISDRRANKCAGQPCLIFADQMQLHYWPVTRQSYDVCNKTGITVTDKNGPTTAVVGSVTFTSPYVVLSMPMVSAGDYCGSIGTVMTNVVVTVAPNSLSSANGLGGHILATSYSFNYGDLAPNDLPASAWFQQGFCYSQSAYFQSPYVNATGAAWTSSFGVSYPECGTIWQDGYYPILDAPTEIHNLQPEWATCSAVVGLFDPPVALQSADAADSVTLPVAVTTPSPTPSQTPNLPQQTSAPVADSSPSTPAAASSAASPAVDLSTAEKSTAQPSTAVPSTANSAPADPTTADPSTVDPSTADSPTVVISPSDPLTAGPSADPVGESSRESTHTSPAAFAPSTATPAAEQMTQDAAGAIASALAAGTSVSTDAHSGDLVTAQASASDDPSTGPTDPQPSATKTTDDPGADPSGIGNPASTFPTAQTVASIKSLTSQDAVSAAVVEATAESADPATSAGAQQPAETGDQASTANLHTTIPLPAATGGAASSAAVVILGDSSFTAASEGDGILLGSNTRTVGGSAQTVNGQIASAVAEGLVVSSNVVDAASIGSTVILTASGHTLTAVQQAGSIILLAGTTSIILDPASPNVVNGLTVSTAPEGGIAVGSTTLTLPNPTASASATQTVVSGSNGHLVTISCLGSSLVLADASSTTTVARATQVSFAGETYTFQDATIVHQGSAVIVVEGSSSTVLGPGTRTTVNGEVVSAPSGEVSGDGSSAQVTVASNTFSCTGCVTDTAGATGAHISSSTAQLSSSSTTTTTSGSARGENRDAWSAAGVAGVVWLLLIST